MSIDPEPGAYRSAGYNAVKKPLDDMIDAGYDQGLYYYYVIYVPDGEDIRLIMDYEDAYTCGQPIYEYGENEYTKVLETGEKIVVADDISSYGSWMFVLLPLKDRRGHVVAELEVGTSADQLKKEGRRMIIENLCSILCTSAVVIMLLLELLFAMNFYEQRRKIPAKERQIMEVVPIRLLLFLSEGTDCMQDAFIAILCSKLYETSGHTGWLSMIPMGIAIALPMSLQLMMAAIASLLGGKLAQKYGTVRIMTIGFFTQIVGFFVCAVVGSAYEGILFGKILIGLGFGLIYVSANTMAAMGDGDKSAQAFTDVSAGVLSGVTIGVGLGSILLDLGNYQMVYLAGAILLTAGLLILLSTWKTASAAELLRTHASADMTKTGSAQNNMEEAAASAKKIGILQFMLDRQVITFFLLILTPFMMSLAYREYFFPLFVQNYGITEVQIGQIYLLCGLSTLYLGPLLAKILLNGIGAKKSILLASGLMAANMMMFVLKPTLFSALIGVGIFSVIISFAYTCQYTYFEDVPVVRWYGEGGSMGIYSMFESLGQTLGPMLYGVALGCGTRRGIFLIAAAMTVMMILFRFLNSERKQG
jgi:MFS family permease